MAQKNASVAEHFGARMTELRKAKGWSQAQLAKSISASREIIGRYERADVVASIEMAKRIADAFGVTLDYLVGEGEYASFGKRTLERFEQIEELTEREQEHVFFTLDAMLRDARARRTYAV